MGEAKARSAKKGMEAPPGRASSPDLSEVPTTTREVDALAKRLVKTNTPDLLAEIAPLSPRLKAYLATTDEWAILVKALQVDVVTGASRMTQSQRRGIDLFKREAAAIKKEDDKGQAGDSYEVEAGGAGE